MHKFEFAVDLRLNEVIGTLDPDGKYKVQFEVSSMGRRVFGVSPEQGEESIAGEPDATLDEIRHTQVKLVTFNYTGAELDSMATNGMITFHLRASWGQSGQFWDNFAEIKDIRVTQTFENTTVPLAMREGKSAQYGFNGMLKDENAYGSGNSYTTTDRPYNPRIGRWWKRDKLASAAPGWTPYRYGFDNPIRFIDEDGKFEINPEIRQKYPKVTLILENADKLYNNQQLSPEVLKLLEGIDIQKVFNENFRPAFEKYSEMNDQEIQELIKPGQGPLITEESLTTIDENWNYIDINGRNRSQFEITGKVSDLDVNIKRENEKTGEILIDNEVLQVLEFTLGGEAHGAGFGGKTSTVGDRNRAFETLISTLFHEAVHFGRNLPGNSGNEASQGDQGKEFEKDAFGKDVRRLKIRDLPDQR